MTFRVRGREFASGTHVMGIVNVTTDSFFAASRAAADEAAERAVKMVADGAAIIDIGAQSTRPGAREIGALEEMSLLLPALERVREATDAPISVDTFYPEVAEAALAAGADMINDVSCLRFSGLAEVTARYGAAICIMHNRRGSTVPDLTAGRRHRIQPQRGRGQVPCRSLRSAARDGLSAAHGRLPQILPRRHAGDKAHRHSGMHDSGGKDGSALRESARRQGKRARHTLRPHPVTRGRRDGQGPRKKRDGHKFPKEGRGGRHAARKEKI